MTYEEIRQSDPLRYARLEQVARDLRLIRGSETLRNRAAHFPYRCFEGHEIHLLEGGDLEFSEYLKTDECIRDMKKWGETPPAAGNRSAVQQPPAVNNTTYAGTAPAAPSIEGGMNTVTFAEIQKTDPMRYMNVERLARKKGLITENQSLTDLSTNDQSKAWMEGYTIHALEGGTMTPGQYMTAYSLAFTAKRMRRNGATCTFDRTAGRQPVQPVATPEEEEQRQALAASMAEIANRLRRDHAAPTGTGAAPTPQLITKRKSGNWLRLSPEQIALANQLAETYNKTQQRKSRL